MYIRRIKSHLKIRNEELPDLSRHWKEKTYSDRLKHLGLPTLEYRRKRADMVDVYKILNSTDLVSKDKLFKMATYQATRGHPLKLFKSRSRVNVRAGSFSMRVIDTWNVVQAPLVDSFKSRLNKYWHGHPLKFEAFCYIPGVQRTLLHKYRCWLVLTARL